MSMERPEGIYPQPPQSYPALEQHEQSETPAETYRRAQRLQEAGDIHGATELYFSTGYAALGVRVLKEAGLMEEAYQAAKAHKEYGEADQLAVQLNITDHEFNSVPYYRGGDSIQNISYGLESRLRPGATGERLGFSGFQDKVVADVGTRDGRFVPLFRKLGAKDVYGIDPSEQDLQVAVDEHILEPDHAIATTAHDVPEELKGTFDVVAVFNILVPNSERAGFIQDLSDLLKEGGELLITAAETETLLSIRRLVEQRFKEVQAETLWKAVEGNGEHKFLIVAHKPTSAPQPGDDQFATLRPEANS